MFHECAQTLEDTVDSVHRIMASQGDLKSACETIEAYQSELDGDLTALAENLDLELEALQLQVGAVQLLIHPLPTPLCSITRHPNPLSPFPHTSSLSLI